MQIRQPIVAVLGHVDHGKTSLLDRIRGSAVASKEAGSITQHAGASEIPADIIRKTAGHVLNKFKIDLQIPGLLMLDTPGHEAFTTIRKRGSSIADLAILVVDVQQGFQPQTDEALNFLKEFKTPFVVAATKLDTVVGWKKNNNESFSETFSKQPKHVQEELDGQLYKLIGQLSERGFESERFDRVTDFKKMVSVVPISSISGEGFPELLVMLVGLAQAFLKEQLQTEKGVGKGSIMEIKDVKGLGVTADVILYDGEIKRGDFLVIGGKEIVTTKIRGLLKPKPLKEIRVEKDFENVEKISAASGVKIYAPDLDKAIAGSPIISVPNEDQVEMAKRELSSVVESVEFSTSKDGIIIRADTLGSLEALEHMISQRGIPVRKAEVGAPARKDIVELENVSNPLNKVLMVFNIPVQTDIEQAARDKKIVIINNNIIYRLFEEYENFTDEEKRKMRESKLASITLPCKIKLLPGFVFRASDPAVVGVEVLAGEIKTGVTLLKNGTEIGIVKGLQMESQTISKATKGQRIAVSIQGPTVGRHIKENDELHVQISQNDIKTLEELEMYDMAALARKTSSG